MDSYANHLAQVNDVQDVIAADDILNAQGQILVKKGTAIDRDMAERVARFKLQKPLENSVFIDNELTAETLYQCFDVFLSSDPYISSLNQTFSYSDTLREHCKLFCSYPLLKQKLTVLSLIMPAIFEQAMFCGWLGMVLSQALGERVSSSKSVFLASMSHDLGMVHISEEVLSKQGVLTLEEWKQIQAHPVIGYNIVKDIKGIGASVARAVLEHHENIDGTGYPRGSLDSTLAQEGQLLNLLDSINAIYCKHFKPFNRSLRGLIPIIQMNQQSRYDVAARQLILMLRELPPQQNHGIPAELAADVISEIQSRNVYLIRCVDICADIASKIGFRHDDAKIANVQNAIIHITMSITQSGIVNSAYTRWLDQVASEKLVHAYGEVEEAYLTLQEIIYHIEKLVLQIQLYLEKHGNTAIAQYLAEGLQQLTQEKRAPVAPHIAKLWIFTR